MAPADGVVHLRPADADDRLGLDLVEHALKVGVDALEAVLVRGPLSLLLHQVADGRQLHGMGAELRVHE
jgi:hypothetical protein